ncbi:unnamed protein product [Ilex paraguariensis]|uniref:Uncharacterized protein n=1 Tax=Ilex paraguariensis TaxID=185542 RepID=A0ABC8UVY9_9AQUA
MAATSPSSLSQASTTLDSGRDLINWVVLTQIRSHEVAIAELNNLPSSRLRKLTSKAPFFSSYNAVYQINGNIFFCTTVQKATAFEQRKIDTAKAKFQKLNSS